MTAVPIASFIAVLTGCKFPVPADVPDDDVGIDGALDGPHRTGPLLTNHQPADLVLGQRDFVTLDTERPHGPRHLSYVHGLSVQEDRLWASDYAMDRVLLFQPLPTINEPAGSLALGSADLFTPSPPDPVSGSNLDTPTGVADTGTKLLVVDTARNRVLIWNSIPSQGTARADLVLGATSVDSAGTIGGPGSFWSPTQVWSDGARVVVADPVMHRVQIWRTFPTRNGQLPDVVLGQAAIDQSIDPVAPTARSLKSPMGIASDGTLLVVSDPASNRVLVWRAFPDVHNAPADLVIGQRDFETIGPGDSPTAFAQPAGVALIDGALLVADSGNARVLIFDPAPTTNVADVSTATQVLGQANPSVVDRQQPLSARTLSAPRAIAAGGGYVFVADYLRTLRYRLALP